ncbi:hypothetical protein PCASD_21383 [Puccinia coronata f. sp. avenae]|uniref:Uncharacterized protein n=1 Tax=Puccinia coronata f. sp. avenae TaxID=200324 RepID=A0A2N5SHH2_9BASI|nr:hypothetical protein PCASD_21383 [Puccinia coronata f. sp. avenae]
MPIGPGYQWAAQTQSARGFGLVSGSLLGARRALPPGGSNWVVQSRSCLLALEQTNSSTLPPSSTPPPRQQLPIDKCDGTSKQPTRTNTSPSPGKQCRYLSGRLSLKRSCHPSHILLPRGARGQYDCARQAPNPTGYPQAARGLNELVSDLGSASLGVVFARPDRTN